MSLPRNNNMYKNFKQWKIRISIRKVLLLKEHNEKKTKF